MDVSGVVLAGGLSRRLGRDKAVEVVDGQPLIERVIERLTQVVDDTVVVVNSVERGREIPLPHSTNIAVDLYPDSGSLGGIFTGLSAAASEWSIIVACDMPFLNITLFRHMLTLTDNHDAVVPVLDNRPEPTHAIYSKSCLAPIERRLQANDLKIARFFDDVRVHRIEQDVVEAFDPDRLSFFNINTQTDLDKALALVAEGR